MKKYLSASGGPYVIRVFPKVGHDMFEYQSLVNDSWDWPRGYWFWTRRAPGFHDTIVEWIRDIVKINPR